MAGGITLGFLKFVLGFDSLAFQEGATNAQKELKRMEREFRRSADSVGQFGQRMSLSVTAPLVAIAALGVREAQATQQAMAQVNAALASMGPVAGRSAEQLTRVADQLELSSLFEADTILKDVTATLLTFGNVTGDTFDRAQQAVIDLTTRFGGDLAGRAVQVGKALQDPVKGLTALSRVGVSFTPVQQQMIRSLVATGQAAQAQGIILEALEGQVRGSAQAAQDTDPWNKATDAFKQMAEQIGTALLPVLPRIADAVVAITGAFTTLSPGMQTAVIALAGVAAATGPVAIGLGAIMGVLAPFRAATAAAAAGLASIGPAAATATTGIATTAATATAATGRLAAIGATAATAGRALLAAFGGPLGVALAAGSAAIIYFATRTEDASAASGNLDGQSRSTATAIASLNNIMRQDASGAVAGNANALANARRRQADETFRAAVAEAQLRRAQGQARIADLADGSVTDRISRGRGGVQEETTTYSNRALANQRGIARAQVEQADREIAQLNSALRQARATIASGGGSRTVAPVAIPSGGGGGGGRRAGGGSRGESDAARAAAQATREQESALASLRQQYLPVTAAAEEMARATNVLKIAFREGAVTGSQFEAMLAGVKTKAAESTGRIIDWGEFIEPMEQIRLDIPTTEQALSGLSDHFEQQADRMQRAAERQRQAFDTMLSSIQNLAYSLQKGDVAGIISGVLQTLQSFGNMKEGGFNIGGLQFGGARAAGGPVSSGRTYLVGERGPELFTAGRSGMITSNDNLRRGGASGGLRISVDPSPMFSVMVRDEAGRVVAQAAPAIMQGGAAMAQSDMARRSKYAIPG